jgi:hypothetical protein
LCRTSLVPLSSYISKAKEEASFICTPCQASCESSKVALKGSLPKAIENKVYVASVLLWKAIAYSNCYKINYTRKDVKRRHR